MQQIRRRILYITLIILVLASTISLIFSTLANNPTGRWFSSAIPNNYDARVESWRAAELILSEDLRLPDNNREDERQCFCRTGITTPSNCNVCIPVPELSNYRIPDIVSDGLIADSKFYNSSVLGADAQLHDFVTISKYLERPLYIYMPLSARDTKPYTDEALSLVQATGGDIIPYFVVEGYAFGLMAEQTANNLVIFAIIVAFGIFVWAYMARLGQNSNSPSETLPDEVDRAEDSVEETERYMQRMERLSKKVLKDEDKDK